LENIQNIHPEYRKSVASTLKWLAFSLRPLYIEEVAEIFILDHEQALPFDEEGKFDSAEDVLEHLSGLVTPILVDIGYESKKPLWRKNKRKFTEIKFAHFSIQEYLLSGRLHETQACFSIHEQASHLHISESCLAYHLHLSKTILATEETVTTHALWDYVFRNWAFHLERVPRECWPASAKDGTDRILEPQSQALLNMVRGSNPDANDNSDFEVSLETLGAPLYYICRKCLMPIASHLIEEGAGVNEISSNAKHGTALQAAAYRGDNGLVILLLEHGAEIDMEAGYYGTALATAAFTGRIETVQFLLDHGADISAKGGRHGSALATAAFAGNVEAVQLLLDHGANFNVEGGIHGSALATAASWDGIEIMQFLLDQGADVNAKGGLYGNALQTAIASGSEDCVELLLSRGAEIKPLRGQEWDELSERFDQIGARAEYRQEVIQRLRTYGENPQALVEWEREKRKKRQREERERKEREREEREREKQKKREREEEEEEQTDSSEDF
jgi:ankyrin repeat protein